MVWKSEPEQAAGRSKVLVTCDGRQKQYDAKDVKNDKTNRRSC